MADIAEKNYRNEGVLDKVKSRDELKDFFTKALSQTMRVSKCSDASVVHLGYSEELKGTVFLSAAHVFSGKKNLSGTRTYWQGPETFDCVFGIAGLWNDGKKYVPNMQEGGHVFGGDGAVEKTEVFFKQTQHRFDFAIGVIFRNKEPIHLAQASISKDGPQKDEPMFVFGYPASTSRARDDREAHLQKFRQTCTKLIASTLNGVPFLKYKPKIETEGDESSYFDLMMCQSVLQLVKRLPPSSVENIPKGMPLSFSAGHILFHDDWKNLSSADGMDGMSGGAVLSVPSGKLIGIHRSSAASQTSDGEYTSKLFHGLAISNRHSQAFLSEFCQDAKEYGTNAVKLCDFAKSRVQ